VPLAAVALAATIFSPAIASGSVAQRPVRPVCTVGVLATIKVGRVPYHVAVDPKTDMIYAWSSYGTLQTINGKTNTVVSTLSVGVLGGDVAVDPDTDRIYLADDVADGGVIVVDGATGKVITTIPMPDVFSITVDPAADRIYAATDWNRHGRLSVIDGATDKVIAAGRAGHAGSIAVDPRTDTVYVANVYYNSMWVVNGQTAQRTSAFLRVFAGYGTAVDPGDDLIYAATVVNGRADESMTVISGSADKVLKIVSLGYGRAGSGIAVDPRTDTVYQTNPVRGVVSEVDTRTDAVVGTITVGKDPTGVATDPLTGRAYVANLRSGTVSVLGCDS
jgi:DNA-binding beta-propeller fold protein YncE